MRKECIGALFILGFLFYLLITTIVYALPSEYWAIWNISPESDVAGYYLYWKTPGGEFNNADRLQVTGTTEVKLTGSVPTGTTLALTAFDTSGNESEFSDEVPFAGALSRPSGLSVEGR